MPDLCHLYQCDPRIVICDRGRDLWALVRETPIALGGSFLVGHCCKPRSLRTPVPASAQRRSRRMSQLLWFGTEHYRQACRRGAGFAIICPDASADGFGCGEDIEIKIRPGGISRQGGWRGHHL